MIFIPTLPLKRVPPMPGDPGTGQVHAVGRRRREMAPLSQRCPAALLPVIIEDRSSAPLSLFHTTARGLVPPMLRRAAR